MFEGVVDQKCLPFQGKRFAPMYVRRRYLITLASSIRAASSGRPARHRGLGAISNSRSRAHGGSAHGVIQMILPLRITRATMDELGFKRAIDITDSCSRSGPSHCTKPSKRYRLIAEHPSLLMSDAARQSMTRSNVDSRHYSMMRPYDLVPHDAASFYTGCHGVCAIRVDMLLAAPQPKEAGRI